MRNPRRGVYREKEREKKEERGRKRESYLLLLIIENSRREGLHIQWNVRRKHFDTLINRTIQSAERERGWNEIFRGVKQTRFLPATIKHRGCLGRVSRTVVTLEKHAPFISAAAAVYLHKCVCVCERSLIRDGN